MLVASFAAGPWQTNCYVLASGPGEPCLVVDPGQGAAGRVREVIREQRLLPAAVLMTHGHIDHAWSVAPLAGGFGIPALIHADDRYRLDDLIGSSVMFQPAQLRAMMESNLDLAEPDDVRVLADGEILDLVGLRVRVVHAPGHTEGSVVFVLDDEATMLSGDVLFAGSIGRTDLPGGDAQAMARSLQAVMSTAPDQTRVLPGHGPETTIGRERESNPYVAGLPGAGLPGAAPTRGL